MKTATKLVCGLPALPIDKEGIFAHGENMCITLID